MLKRFLILFFFLSLCFSARFVLASDTNGTIDSSYKYGWGENLGWINFKPDNAGLSITDTAITGYAWSRDVGWINFSPVNGGVTNNSSGQLGGYAWSSYSGWTNLSGVTINSSGKFIGTGTSGGTAGRIRFDCDLCDVRTDWRPASARGSASTGSGGGGGGSGYAVPITQTGVSSSRSVTVTNAPLEILPSQSGVLIVDSETGKIVLEIPPNAVSDVTTFFVAEERKTSGNFQVAIQGISLVNSAFYSITATGRDGGLIHSFNTPLTITLPLPLGLRDFQNLGVYWLDEVNSQWVKIPGAIFSNGSVIFSVSHLTQFAIFAGSVGTDGKAVILSDHFSLTRNALGGMSVGVESKTSPFEANTSLITIPNRIAQTVSSTVTAVTEVYRVKPIWFRIVFVLFFFTIGCCLFYFFKRRNMS